MQHLYFTILFQFSEQNLTVHCNRSTLPIYNHNKEFKQDKKNLSTERNNRKKILYVINKYYYLPVMDSGMYNAQRWGKSGYVFNL